MERLLQNLFDLSISEIKKLDGYDNANYLLKAGDERYIFKTYPFDQELLEIIRAETAVLNKIQEGHSGEFPRPIPFENGEFVQVHSVKGSAQICRLLSFVDGQFLGDLNNQPEHARSLGTFLAKLDLALAPLNVTVFKARQWEWDLQYLQLNKKYLRAIEDPSKRSIVAYFMQQFDAEVLPISKDLRKQLIYNDTNEWNVLIKKDAVSGFIDFGDLAHSFLINEVAIAATYLSYDKKEPLPWIASFLAAYHQILPLEKQEVEILYYLIAGRLCTSICNAAHSRLSQPDNDYAGSSEEHAWSLLTKWLEIGPIKATNSFKKAIDMPISSVDGIEKKIERRNQHFSSILSLSYAQPIAMERAAFQYMYDAYGTSYLDAYNNIPHVGHSHPRVVEAGQRQMTRLNTNTRYQYDLLAEYSERLLTKFPKELNKIFLVNSGSAASDLALRLARSYSGFEQVLVMEHGYHGNTQLGIDHSHYKFNNSRGQGQKTHIIKTSLPDIFRGAYREQDAGLKYADDTIAQIKNTEKPIAAFISEPVVGCGGQVPLASGYLKPVYQAIRAQGGICISDEVQTGFGRLGDHFWGFEAQEVVPDIVVLGKPMGNGHPIGAVVCTDAIAQAFEKGVEFFSSFGGNPVSCAIGMAVLEVIEQERLQFNAASVGAYYKKLLLQLQSEHASIGDVRGSGLFLGIDMVQPGGTTADTVLAQKLKNELRERHILVSTDGPYDNVIKSKPPLCFNKHNALRVVETIDSVLKM